MGKPASAQGARIDEYALIGNCRSAALVSRDGSIDWLCWPRYDSPSIFGALLDARKGGRFSIVPSGAFTSTRRYVPDTNVLETTFETDHGVVVLRDSLSVASEEDKEAQLNPEHELLREVRCERGEVTLDVVYEPRPDYGRRQASLAQRGAFGLWQHVGRAAIILRADPTLSVDSAGRRATGRVRMRRDESCYFALTYSRLAPAVLPPLGRAARARLERTIEWWRQWAQQCTYRGPHRDAVVRSALVLKLMTYAPSGAVIAAPTTSLPERIGGSWNWDYRYCWLRDTALGVRALFALGYHLEAAAFVSWLVQATRLTWPELQVLYDVFGEAHVLEKKLDHLAGFADSRPVRVGNAAWRQVQLDVYGELIEAAMRFTEHGGHFDTQTVRLLDDLGQTVSRRWREPDAGIWEARGARLQHTHSKVMCWVALDCLVRLHEQGQITVHVDDFRRERTNIRTAIEEHGYNPRRGTYTSTFDGDDVDANLLLLPVYRYASADDGRMRRTIDAILSRLGHGSLIRRGEDPVWQTEGAFGACSFWAVEALALAGRVDAAERRFVDLLGFANDVGLFAEEIDVETGAAVGNFPQAFTHLGLINAALTLQACSPKGEVSIGR